MGYLRLIGFLFIVALGITILFEIASYCYSKIKKRKNKSIDDEYEDPHIGI